MVVNEVKEKFATIISTITSPKKSPNTKLPTSKKRKVVESDENVDDSSSPSSGDKMNSRSIEDFYKRLKTFTVS